MAEKYNDALLKKTKKTSIGGQALIEGIMMRGPHKVSMAVRNPDGEMIVETNDYDAKSKPSFFRWPFLRGVFGFVESMRFGYKCLMRSAEIAGFDDIEDDTKKGKTPVVESICMIDDTGDPSSDLYAPDNQAELSSKIEMPAEGTENVLNNEDISNDAGDTNDPIKEAPTGSGDKKSGDNSRMMGVIMIIASVLGVALALLLFKAFPEMIYELLERAFPSLSGTGYKFQLIRSLFVGILKIIILVGYMALVSLMKDIRRTFAYHGAEHKSIACYERGLKLTVENVRAQRRFHPRCGTSFLILMLIIGVFITMFIPTSLSANGTLNVVLRTLIGLATIPILMSLGYELIKIAGKHDNLLTRIISAPGMWLQRITTREPDDKMIECAIVALNNVIPDDGSDIWEKK